jgi:UDP-N-acetylmuramate: L-alanyl-gamma-D-glutamyl-meso-diaminopimelate ligase
MKYHFIGISGAGMSAVAKLLIEKGEEITGSDEGFYPPISDYLLENKIPCTTPFSSNNIPADVDYIVIGKHAKLVPEENEEVKAAFDSGKKILSFPQVLDSLTSDKENTVIVGSYGKSSCTSLIAWCMESNHKDPSYFIGALPLTPRTNARVGGGNDFILEGDEYPSSNWDTTSKFLFLHPQNLLVTALAHDHINVFPTHEEYLAPFTKLIQGLPSSGKLIMCLDDETIQKQIQTLQIHPITYGLAKEATYTAEKIEYGLVSSFDLMHRGTFIARMSTSLLGKHNIQNILGISALLLETKKITVEELVHGVGTFKGIVRRLDRKSEKTSIPIYEGFGSSVDKARSAIEAIKLHFPNRRLVVVFEPHTFSWRNRAALNWYDGVFEGTHHVFMYKPPDHGSATHDQLTLDEIVERVQNAGITVIPFENTATGLIELVNHTQSDDVILILSSGGMGGFIPQTVLALEEKFPA